MTKRPVTSENQPGALAAAGAAPQSAESSEQSPLAILREWMDALVVAFVLAMFIRIFMVELFKIPSGSMTPTLIGGRVASVDYNHDGKKDMLLFRDDYDFQPLLFLNNGKRLISQGPVGVAPGEVRREERYDRILVNKMAYWFHPPKRGDIIVFKVPARIWEADKPIYIKRCAGEPGDRLSFDKQGHLVANDKRVTVPDFFETQRYETNIQTQTKGFKIRPETVYDEHDPYAWGITRIKVPKGEVYAFGDNTLSSLDSRYWGGVPVANIKGRAFFRYWPLDQLSFFHGG